MNETLKVQAYRHIRTKLLDGSLRPGSRLTNRVIARELGVSVIPVREAINQLHSEGLIEYRPGVGAFVVEASREEVEELYDLREALEVHAIHRAAARIRPAHLEELERCNEVLIRIFEEARASGTLPSFRGGWVDGDMAFHLALLRVSGNKRLLRTVRELRILSRIFRAHRRPCPLEEMERVCREHGELVEAVRAGDVTRACDVLRSHIRQGCELTLEEVERERMDL